ncbi:MAG: dienelactone hydrolase family protein [Pseudomonadota bacterium]
MKTSLCFIGLMFAATAACAAVQGKEVSYNANGTTLKGYVAYDDAVQGKRPGVLVVHEWWGHNEYARKRARMLAEQGYTALAVDMYGDGKQAHHPDDAGKFASEVAKDTVLAKARFDAALNLIGREATVDEFNIAAIGYCFGGSVVLNMARIGEPLKAVVSFHGGLATDTPAEAGKITARVASFTGEADPMIPASQVAAFRAEMDKAGAIYKAVTYAGAKHSFTNPDADKFGEQFKLPLAYDAVADKASWDESMIFLDAAFKVK